MGNATTKLNRKFDGWLKKAYSYIFKEEELSEISDEAQSDDESNQNVLDSYSYLGQCNDLNFNIINCVLQRQILTGIYVQSNNEPQNQSDQEPDIEQKENVSTHSDQIESIIYTSITKEELLQDKRKASTLLSSEFDPKRVCPNKENIKE